MDSSDRFMTLQGLRHRSGSTSPVDDGPATHEMRSQDDAGINPQRRFDVVNESFATGVGASDFGDDSERRRLYIGTRSGVGSSAEKSRDRQDRQRTYSAGLARNESIMEDSQFIESTPSSGNLSYDAYDDAEAELECLEPSQRKREEQRRKSERAEYQELMQEMQTLQKQIHRTVVARESDKSARKEVSSRTRDTNESDSRVRSKIVPTDNDRSERSVVTKQRKRDKESDKSSMSRSSERNRQVGRDCSRQPRSERSSHDDSDYRHYESAVRKRHVDGDVERATGRYAKHISRDDDSDWISVSDRDRSRRRKDSSRERKKVKKRTNDFTSSDSDSDDDSYVKRYRAKKNAAKRKKLNNDSDTSREMSYRNWLLPDTFDGSTSLSVFLKQVDTCARYNGWTSEDKVAHTKLSLRGNAAYVLDETDSGNDVYEHLEQKLKRRYGTEGQTSLYKSQLRTRKRQKNESLQTLYSEINRLILLAYPGQSSPCRDTMAMDSFLDAINDDDLEIRIRDREPKDLNHALKIALKIEANAKTDPQRKPEGGKDEEIHKELEVNEILTGKCEFTPEQHLYGITRCACKNGPNYQLFIPAKVNGVETKFMLDTNSSVTIIPQRLLRDTVIGPQRYRLDEEYANDIRAIGSAIAEIRIAHVIMSPEVIVCDELRVPLLGKDWLFHNDVGWDLERNVMTLCGYEIVIEQVYLEPEKEEEKEVVQVVCHECNLKGHNKPDCPLLTKVRPSDKSSNLSSRVVKRTVTFSTPESSSVLFLSHDKTGVFTNGDTKNLADIKSRCSLVAKRRIPENKLDKSSTLGRSEPTNPVDRKSERIVHMSHIDSDIKHNERIAPRSHNDSDYERSTGDYANMSGNDDKFDYVSAIKELPSFLAKTQVWGISFTHESEDLHLSQSNIVAITNDDTKTTVDTKASIVTPVTVTVLPPVVPESKEESANLIDSGKSYIVPCIPLSDIAKNVASTVESSTASDNESSVTKVYSAGVQRNIPAAALIVTTSTGVTKQLTGVTPAPHLTTCIEKVVLASGQLATDIAIPLSPVPLTSTTDSEVVTPSVVTPIETIIRVKSNITECTMTVVHTAYSSSVVKRKATSASVRNKHEIAKWIFVLVYALTFVLGSLFSADTRYELIKNSIKLTDRVGEWFKVRIPMKDERARFRSHPITHRYDKPSKSRMREGKHSFGVRSNIASKISSGAVTNIPSGGSSGVPLIEASSVVSTNGKCDDSTDRRLSKRPDVVHSSGPVQDDVMLDKEKAPPWRMDQLLRTDRARLSTEGRSTLDQQ